MRKNEGPTEWNARVEENDDYILEWKRRKQKRNTIPGLGVVYHMGHYVLQLLFLISLEL